MDTMGTWGGCRIAAAWRARDGWGPTGTVVEEWHRLVAIPGE